MFGIMFLIYVFLLYVNKFTTTKLCSFYSGIIPRVTSAFLTNASHLQTWIWRQMSQVSGWSIPPLRTLATSCCPKWMKVTHPASVTHGKPHSTSMESPTLSWCVVYSMLHTTSTKKWKRSSTRLIQLRAKKDSTSVFISKRCSLIFFL